MLKLISKAQAQFMKNEDGATAIEYGLIAAGIAVAISVVVFTFGDQLVLLFEGMTTVLAGAGSPPPA
jgi:pilus assembly protein Flp/PilA